MKFLRNLPGEEIWTPLSRPIIGHTLNFGKSAHIWDSENPESKSGRLITLCENELS